MLQALGAAIAYFAVVFAAGFALGAVRVLWLEPALGGLMAVLVELPVMLGLSFAMAALLVRRFSIRPGPQALAMCAVAFVLLQAAEFGLSLFMGLAASAYLAGLTTAKGMIGMTGQAAFGLMPYWAARRMA